MTIDDFWKHIDASRKAGGSDAEALCEELRERLGALEPAEILDFRRHLDQLMARASTWDLWGAAYIINGGCSDDGFDYFRAWLVSRGRAAFEGAVANADGLADLRGIESEECELESLMYAPLEAYEEATGDEMPHTGVEQPGEPSGEPWSEDGDELARRFPKLWKKFGDIPGEEEEGDGDGDEEDDED